MTTQLRDLEVDEISILGKHSRPAVRAAQIAIIKADANDSENYFDRKIAAIGERDACSYLVAMSKARIEAPEDFRRYQLAGATSRPIFKAGPRNEAVRIFENIVRIIRHDNPKIDAYGSHGSGPASAST